MLMDPEKADSVLESVASGAVRKRVVIVGGGIGGLMLASRLGRRYRRKGGVAVYLVDRAPVHVWKPILHTFAAGAANAHEDGVPFVAQAKRAGFVYLPGEFYAIDAANKEIAIRINDLPGRPELTRTVPYDLAVIAVGSRANDFGVDGVQAHCHFIDNLWQAEALNQALRHEIIYRAISGGDINVAVVGGGATGVEFVAETARLVEIGEAFGAADLRKRLRLTLLDAGERILGAFPKDVAEQTAAKLDQLGVSIETNANVVRVDADGFELVDGRRINAAVKVWTAGVKAPAALSGLSAFERARGGQIVVTSTLQTTTDQNIFAIGDCASLTLGDAERPLPPTGQVARQQADYLAAAIPKRLAGAPFAPFKYREMGSLVSLSQYGAYGSLAGRGVLPTLALSGWFAMRAHELFYRMHQFGLYGPARGAVVMARDGLNALVKPPARMD